MGPGGKPKCAKVGYKTRAYLNRDVHSESVERVMKRTIKALSQTQPARVWQADSRQPGILHVFDNACNLINERGEILSIVMPQIGNGPFNLVIDGNVQFSEYLNIESPVSILGNHLLLGDVTVRTNTAKLWDSHPDWETLHGKRGEILDRLDPPEIPGYQSPIPIARISALAANIVLLDRPSATAAAEKLAGLGVGLTPSGDDIIMGALYAAWIIHPMVVASDLAREIAEAAAPSTTSLSAAWIRSAGRFEAGGVWHGFFDALIAGEDVQLPIAKILSVGETSGEDALAGFLGVISAFKERIIDECPS